MTRPIPPASPPAPARPTRALLVDARFGPWFFGLLVSNTGNWLFNVTAAVVVYELTRSALMVGLVSVGQFAPLVLVSPWAGALSDRFDRRRLLLGAQVLAATAAAAIAVTTLLVGVDGLPGPWPVVAASFGIGLGGALAAPSLNALVPALVDDTDLESAVALTSLTFNAGRALGPATSAVLLATVGAEIAFTLNAVSFAGLIVALLLIRPRRIARATGGDRSVRAGLRFVLEQRTVLLLLVGVGAAGFAADPVITLTPPLADALGGGASMVAVFVSAFGIAAAPAAWVSGSLQRRLGSLDVAALGLLGMAVGLTVAAAAAVPPLAVAAFAATGAGFVFAVTGFTTLLQREVPDALRGRVMALWSVSFLGTRPLAALVDGFAGDQVGPRLAMGIGIAVALAGALLAAWLRGSDHRPAGRAPATAQR